MIALRAKVSWIVCGHRLAVGEAFDVESERHAAGLLARGDAERVAVAPPAPSQPDVAPALPVQPPEADTPPADARKTRGRKA